MKEKLITAIKSKNIKHAAAVSVMGFLVALIMLFTASIVPAIVKSEAQGEKEEIPAYATVTQTEPETEPETAAPTETESATEEETVPAVDTSKLKVDKTATAKVATGNAKVDQDSGETKSKDSSTSSSNAPAVAVNNSEIKNAQQVQTVNNAGDTNSIFVPKQGLNGLKTIEGNLFYFDAEGNPVTGHQLVGGIRYYFNKYGAKASKTGIDVSKYQGNIDWQKVKAAGVDFAIIRLGFTGYGKYDDYGNPTRVQDKARIDNYFEKNLSGAKAAGIDVGVYYFSQAISAEEAVYEASLVVNNLKGRGLQYPVYFDTEFSSSPNRGGRADGLSRQTRTQCAIAFCETVRNAGYTAGVYASKSFFENQLVFSSVSRYEIWVAHYTSSVTSFKPYRMWQYTSSGTINGISGRVDVNISLYDYKNRTDMSNIGKNVIFITDDSEKELFNKAEAAVAALEATPNGENLAAAESAVAALPNKNMHKRFLERIDKAKKEIETTTVTEPEVQTEEESTTQPATEPEASTTSPEAQN